MSFDIVEDLKHYSQAFYDQKKLVFSQSVLVGYMQKSGPNVFC